MSRLANAGLALLVFGVFLFAQSVFPPAGGGASKCSGLSDAGTGCTTNVGTIAAKATTDYVATGGNAGTADALAANPANCSAGNYPLGVDASGAVESCTAASAGALVLLESHTASASATIDFTTCITSTYDDYEFHLMDVLPATNDVVMRVLVSTDGGSNWQASAYTYAISENAGDSATGSISNSTSASALDIAGKRAGIGNGTGKGFSFVLHLADPLNASRWKNFWGMGNFVAQGNNVIINPYMGGQWQTSTAVNAIRFLTSSGNITSGEFRVYGVAK